MIAARPVRIPGSVCHQAGALARSSDISLAALYEQSPADRRPRVPAQARVDYNADPQGLNQTLRRTQMKVGFRSLAGVAVALALMWIAVSVISAQQQGGAAIAIDNDDIGGVVTSTKGPEAGVLVTAETRELPTHFANI